MQITKEMIDQSIEIIEEMADTEDESLTEESVVEYMLGQGLSIPDAHSALSKAYAVMEYREQNNGGITQTV